MMGTNEMDKKENKTIRKNKTIKFIILSVLIIAVISLAGFAFARYITSLNGQTQVQIAQWNFKVTAGGSQNLSINLAETRFVNDTTEVDRTTVAPGTKGALVLNIDATGNQVSLEYDIDLSLTQVPENLIFYSDAEMTNAFLKENGAIHLDGYFLANAENKTASKTIYWQWPIETGSTQTEIDDNDELDSNWIGDDVILGIAATGKQIMGDPDEEYTVTFDLNGGTLANHGDSTQVTKQVVCGEAYGDLPTPTREGYTFKGWNGKNMFSGLQKGKRISTSLGYEYNSGIGAVSDYIYVDFKKGDYYLSGLADSLYSCVYSYNENKEYIGRTTATTRRYALLTTSWVTYIKGDVDTSGDVSYIRIAQYENIDASGTIDDIDNLQVQLEEGSTATAYEPYYVTDTTPVTQNKNHTLTAIWEPISN